MFYPQYQMFLHSDRKDNDCIQKLQCHCIQILHSDIYSAWFNVLPMASCAVIGENIWRRNKISVTLSYSREGQKENKWSPPWMSLIFMAIGSSQSEAKYHTHHQEALLIQKSQPCIWGNHDFV